MRIIELSGESVFIPDSLKNETGNHRCLFIEFYEKKILFDIGQSDLCIHNAERMGIDLSQVDYLVISNSHSGQEGGLKHFFKINRKAKVFLHINTAYKFYAKIYDGIPFYICQDQKLIAWRSRICFIDEDTQIDDRMILLEGFTEVFPQPGANRALVKNYRNRFNIDKIRDELVMLLIENDEIVLFSGTSHSGIINIIEEVRLFSKTMRIKARYLTQ